MTKTIIFIAHPEVDSSNTQQFLIESGRQISQVDYVDLYQEWEENGSSFDVQTEQARLVEYQRIIFQFPLYWYQAPSILKEWIDQIFMVDQGLPTFTQRMAGKELGIVVTADVKASHYQAGGKVGWSLSEILTPYQALARYFNMVFLPIFPIHQFALLQESDKMGLMYQYITYLEKGSYGSRREYQRILLDKLDALTNQQLPLDAHQQVIFDMWLESFEEQSDEINELFDLSE